MEKKTIIDLNPYVRMKQLFWKYDFTLIHAKYWTLSLLYSLNGINISHLNSNPTLKSLTPFILTPKTDERQWEEERMNFYVYNVISSLSEVITVFFLSAFVHK